jgi:subtilase family serine protease
MTLQQTAMKTSLSALAVLALGTINPAAQAAALGTRGVQLAVDQGHVTTAQEQTVTVLLKLHDQAGFDQAVQDLYDPQSPRFHQWFTDADFAKYAPTAAELQTVRAALERQGLQTVSVDPLNFSLRVRGSSSALETAFQTELHGFSYKNTTFQAPVGEPKLAGAAGELVAATVGLERHTAHPQLTVAKNPQTGQALFQQPISATQTAASIYSHITGTPLTAPQKFTLKALGIPLPYADYTGPGYDLNFVEIVSYTPAQLQQHYGLTPLMYAGYDGQGQKIALLEAYGYAAAQTDANTAATAFDLPPLTAANFQVVYPEGQPENPNDADLTGWTTEIALDIQSAHAIAPAAKLIEVASAGQDNEDQIASLEYILRHRLANIVSCSWENDPEIISGAAEEQAFNSVLERMAAAGISVQFASGDSGDQGLGTPVGAVSVPSNSPYATAVGGTSVFNDPLGSGDIVTGWGTNVSFLETIGQVYDPPSYYGFAGGAGGGQSQYYAKPSWQKALPGNFRQVPDVSAVADPYTGVPVVVTVQGTQNALAGVGGTSLATPVFSAIWAIAQQYNREALGQAAPVVARLPQGAITDVVDSWDLSADNLSGTIVDQNGSTFYPSNALFNGATFAQTSYLVAMSPLGNLHSAFAVAFGTDTSLTVGPGWDNVTGFGTPNGLPFIQGVGTAKKKSLLPLN